MSIQPIKETNYKIYNNCINYSMQFHSNDRTNKNKSTCSLDDNYNKRAYKFFTKLKYAYCNAMIENPKDEKFENKTIALFF